ncbi:hypothetical protein QYF36_025067 [Acer negundo]|nr:hypothetical protein QYF36_025067 [Acer negundo]
MSCMHRWSDKLELKNVVVWRDKCVSYESQLPCKDSISSLIYLAKSLQLASPIIESEPGLPTTARAAPNPSPQILQDSPANDALRTGEDLDSLHQLERAEVEDSDVEPEPESTRVLKSLRRGPGPGPGPTTQSLSSSLLAKKKKQQLERTCSGNGDDDIDEFSSPEDLIFRGF